jgi:hypothetical protein
MEGNARTWFTPKQRAELWERWRSGQCVADIARALARRNKSGVYRVLALHGGIAPTPRPRGPEALSPGAPCGVTMARRAEPRAGVVAGADRRLKQQFPVDPGMQLSHETIYRSLFIQTRGVLKKELMAHLRTVLPSQGRHDQERTGTDRVSIRERPAEVEDRAVPGHWEGDLLCGVNNTHIGSPRPLNTCADCLLNCAAPGTAARKWLTTRASPLPPKCRFISAIHTVLGRAADALAFALRDPRPRVWQRRFCAVG